MSNVNYSLNNRGVRLISSENAWIKGKNGRLRLNPNYRMVGKVDTSMPNMIVTTEKGKKSSYKGDVTELNKVAKKQIVDHFYDEKGKRNKRTVAYFGIAKSNGCKGVNKKQ